MQWRRCLDVGLEKLDNLIISMVKFIGFNQAIIRFIAKEAYITIWNFSI